MSLARMFMALADATPLTVNATDDTQVNTRLNANCYSGIRIGSNNIIYASSNTGVYTVHNSSYVSGGTTSDVWVQRTINSGSLTTDDIGASRVSCSTSRLLEIIDSSDDGTASTCNVTVSFYDAASGGNLLDTATYALSASYIGI